ncbi:MAG: ribonuclease HII [Chloroflexota bacterium]|nr:ribonuclease HII [Chloroflexota bacterium]
MSERTLRATPNISQELQLWEAGYRRVAGVDEAGRGAWAGAVYAGAVVLADDPSSLEELLDCVDDSKKLTPTARERAFGVILAHARYAGIGAASNEEIDRLGIAPATRLAWRRALDGLRGVDYLLLDAFRLPESDLPQLALVRGDAQSLSIAAASILAKVARDRQMRSTATTLPHYGFERNKGYGTPHHRHALRLHGPCALHRRSFAPIRNAQPERSEE